MSKMRFFALQELSNRKPLEVIAPSNKLSDYYGSHVFDRKKMQEYLPKEAYKAVTDAIEKGTPISREIADLIANGMKSWAKSLNVTHYTHWFQPLTDGTAEKHDGFIEFGEDGGVIERFSGKLLIQQEPDASSFPNGGIRNTFEARGYTAWDVSSPAFVVDTTLCIPTIFISYTGEALDYKTPLLKALAAVDKAATEVCQLFDKNITRVYTNLGWEQEYFLVDSSLYNARPDLCLTGRTLMGHSSAKDQQLEDHYFGSIPPRVTAFMKELEIECHKLGIPAKTRHNEVAPNQFELAPIFENCNLANDHNQLVMDLMKRIARKHHFNVLLHEKPYSGVNGSGKHNNWSLCTDTGINLFAPGKNPKGNMLFLTFLVNALMMVYKNQDLLRASIMSASNSYRLGANEVRHRTYPRNFTGYHRPQPYFSFRIHRKPFRIPRRRFFFQLCCLYDCNQCGHGKPAERIPGIGRKADGRRSWQRRSYLPPAERNNYRLRTDSFRRGRLFRRMETRSCTPRTD